MAETDINPTPKAGNPGFNEILGSLLILFGLLLSLAVVSYDNQAAMGLKPGTVENWTGTVGHYGAMLLFILFGKASYILGPLMAYMGIRGLVQSRSEDYVPGLLGSLTMVTALALFFHFYTPMTYSDVQGTDPISGGGALGYRVGELLRFLFGTYGAFLVALGILVPGFLYTFRLPFPEFLNLTRSRLGQMKKGGQTGFHRLLYVLFPPPAQKEEMHEEPLVQETSTTGEAALKDWSEMAGHVRKEPRSGMTYQDYSNQDDTMKEPLWEKKEQNGRKPWIEKRVVESEAPHRPSSWKPAASGRYHSGMDPMKQSLLEMENQREVFGRYGEDGSHHSEWPDSEGLPQARSLDDDSDDLEELNDDFGGRDPGNPIPGYFDRSGRSFHFQRKRVAPYRKQEDGFLGVLELEPGLRRRPDEGKGMQTGGQESSVRADSRQLADQARFVSPSRVLDLDREASVEGDELEYSDEQGYSEDAQDFTGTISTYTDSEESTVDDAGLEEPEEMAMGSATHSLDAANSMSGNATKADEASSNALSLEDDSAEESALQIPRPPAAAKKPGGEGITTSIYEPDTETLVPPITGLKGYKLPLSILQFSRRPERNDVAREIEGVKEQLEAVMRDYSFQASVVHATRGPMITQYEVRPEPGVRVNRLLRIQDEIRMHLAAHSVRIVAPIPGKSTIGIELPNSVRETVTLGDLARKDENFFARHRELGIALGKDIAGSNLYVDLARLPHLLIAGATGSGKSVYMNSVIASILYNRSPEEVRFLMVDPKMVELKLYEGIPHLLYPVITDVRKASRALQWAVQEMERRYQILSKRKVRDIRSFNEKVKEGRIDHDPMPYVVVLIDELSDLMMVSAKDVEDSIIRLTQKARAVGIHLIMATQRPSVDVITALIKANCPARIAFQVAQKTDSRVILDSNGAESLLGRGDMLYKSPTAAAPVRIQSPMVSEEEIEDIVREARKHGAPNFVELPGEDMESEGAAEDVDSELLSEAWKIILESGKTSTSYVQRRLRIGYNRAANLIENLEQMGYLGPAIGNRPREILKRD
ncbi:MAG: hypothetical protein CMF59_08880 [Leptospiraceae bacterium]|nr:hypothetical protein [Leptospiraceae bacterium]